MMLLGLQTQTFHLKENFTKLYKTSSTKVLGQIDSPSAATKNIFFGSELVKTVSAFPKPKTVGFIFYYGSLNYLHIQEQKGWLEEHKKKH